MNEPFTHNIAEGGKRMVIKSYKTILLFILQIITLFTLSGCGKERNPKLVNEQSFSLKDIEELAISYDDEEVSFFQSEGENLMIREYMSKDKKSYHAKISQNKKSIQIHEGGKPLMKGGFTRHVDVYLPGSYSKNLKVTVTDGNINMRDMHLNLNSMRVDCTSGTFELKKAVAGELYFSSTSGTLKLGSITGSQIRIETTHGEVNCEKVNGDVTYTSTSGNAEFLSASGSGTYRADNSGKLSVTYDEVTGDLFFFNKNDNVEVRLPAALSFEFEAYTKNGSVTTNFQADISVNGDLTGGTVGKDPEVTVKVETKNGNIEVRK